MPAVRHPLLIILIIEKVKEEIEINSTGVLIPENRPASSQLHTYTIENDNGTRLVLSNVGAAVMSIFTTDKKGTFSDIVMGYETPADYLADDYYIGTIVGRNANRIYGDSIDVNGRRYKISTKEGGFHHHGGKTGFNKKIFLATPFKQEGVMGVTFEYTSAHLEEGFPGELHLKVIYTLDNEDRWSVEYKAVSNQDTFVNLTQHTYFNLTGDPSNKIDEHELKMLSRYYLPVNEMLVPLGDIVDVSGTPFDFTQFKKIGRDINKNDEQLNLGAGYDHSFVLEKEHTGDLKHAAVVKENITGRKLDVYTTEPSVHLYTGNFLIGVKGKNNSMYNKRSGLCLETQHFPDAPNHPHFPSTLLKAGELFYSKTVFKFSVE